MNVYLVNSTVRLTNAIVDSSGNPLVPIDMVLTIQDPSGCVTCIDMANMTTLSPGVFFYDVIAACPGTWTYNFSSTTGVFTTAAEAAFNVIESQIPAPTWTGAGGWQPT